MWQRIQTVFLTLTAVAMVATLFFPVWVREVNGSVAEVLTPLYYEVKSDGSSTITYIPYCITAVLLIAATTMALFALGKYRNRLLQIKMGALNSLIMALAVASAAYFTNKLINPDDYGWRYGLGLFIPMGGVLFNFLANRFIRRDEKLVRDSDRLR